MDRRPPRDVTRGTRSAMTSVEIIEEARHELRPVYTKRPETPQEEARRALRDLFSRNPSSHSIAYVESRPCSSNINTRLPPLDLQLKGGSYASANETDTKVIPRPPADPNRPLRRTSSRSRLLLPLSSVMSESSIEDDTSRTKSGSLTDVSQLSSRASACETSVYDSPRRVHSGPKERTQSADSSSVLNAGRSPVSSGKLKSASSQSTPDRDSAESQEDISQAKQKYSSKNGTGDHTNKMISPDTVGSTRKNDSSSSLSKKKKVSGSGPIEQGGPQMTESNGASQGDYYMQRVAPILEEMQSSNVDAEKSMERLEVLASRLYLALEAGNLLGKTCQSRSIILHTVFKFLDRGSARLVLRLARLILALKISGSNLQNVCQKILRISRESKNERLFAEENVIDILIDTLCGVDHVLWPQVLVYSVSALKFVSDNSSVVKSLASKQNLNNLAQILTAINKTVTDNGRTDEQLDILNRLTAVLCNVASVSGSSRYFMSMGLIPEICCLISVWSQEYGLMLNVSRILSKLTMHTGCCAAVASDPLNFKYFINLLRLHQKLDLVLRVCFILGNLTAKLDPARHYLFAQPLALETLVDVLANHYQQDLTMSEEVSTDTDAAAGQTSSSVKKKVEDVLVKVVRVIANASISEEIGQLLTSSSAVVDLLLKLLESKDVAVNEELVLNTIVTINNLSFYSVDGSVISKKRLAITELLLKFIEVQHQDSLAETVRVLGNLSREKNVRDHLVRNKIDEAVVAMLDSGNRELVFAACGVLINLMVDEEKRNVLLRHNGVAKLIDVLRDMGRSDWQLAGMVCQTLWNYSGKITSTNACFGDDSSVELVDLLTDLLDDEALLDDADVDDEMKDYVRSTWESEFCPVANDLLVRIETHQSQFEPLKRRP